MRRNRQWYTWWCFYRLDWNKVLCVFLFEKVDTIFAPVLDSVRQVTQHVNSFSTGNTHDMPRSGNFLLGLKALHDGFLPQPQWKKDWKKMDLLCNRLLDGCNFVKLNYFDVRDLFWWMKYGEQYFCTPYLFLMNENSS